MSAGKLLDIVILRDFLLSGQEIARFLVCSALFKQLTGGLVVR
jgi:hypothetical protein